MSDDKNNTGAENSGYRNSGDWNSGNWNSGNWNSGDWNSGNGNSGDWNSGYGSSGNWNSGNWNSGYGSSGNWNSGNWNSGYGNSCNRSAGIFCNKDPQVFLFNKATTKKWFEIDHPHFDEFYLTKWISDYQMTDAEKAEDPQFHLRGGYLKKFTYSEAWANFWRDTDEENRKKFLALPNFDAEVFKDITGIDTEKKHSCAGRVIEIDGEEYILQPKGN